VCLGIPGQVQEFSPSNPHLARVEVTGVVRTVNVGLLEDEGLVAGDWVLIHVGFAMSKIDEREAALALASLRMMGAAYDTEMEAFESTTVADDARGG
jgi:hydrogenase expression/formation protein HypC